MLNNSSPKHHLIRATTVAENMGYSIRHMRRLLEEKKIPTTIIRHRCFISTFYLERLGQCTPRRRYTKAENEILERCQPSAHKAYIELKETRSWNSVRCQMSRLRRGCR